MRRQLASPLSTLVLIFCSCFEGLETAALRPREGCPVTWTLLHHIGKGFQSDATRHFRAFESVWVFFHRWFAADTPGASSRLVWGFGSTDSTLQGQGRLRGQPTVPAICGLLNSFGLMTNNDPPFWGKDVLISSQTNDDLSIAEMEMSPSAECDTILSSYLTLREWSCLRRRHRSKCVKLSKCTVLSDEVGI